MHARAAPPLDMHALCRRVSHARDHRQGSPNVELTQSNDCGICAAVCPTGALEAQAPTNAELIKLIEQRKDTAWIAFTCKKAVSRPDERVIQVSCLARLDESILVNAASRGIDQVLLVDGACADCANAIAHDTCVRTVEESNTLLLALGASPRVAFVAELTAAPGSGTPTSAAAPIVSRRAFVSMLSRETKHAVALASGAIENASETGTEIKKGELPQLVPPKRKSLLEACQRFSKDGLGDSWIQSQTWATCLIKDTCTGCNMCALSCPTGALSKTEQEGKPALAFRLALCTNCHLCQDICFWKALELSPRVELGKALRNTSETLFFPRGAIVLESPDTELTRLIQSIH